jgi:outer membrane cobalamin receptor
LSTIRRSLLFAFCISTTGTCLADGQVVDLNLVSAYGRDLPSLQDTTRVQSKADSLSPVRAFETAISILPTKDSISVIKRIEVRWDDYSYLGDLLWEIPGAFIRDLGSMGQPSQLTLRGLGWHDIAVLVDGRSVNEPLNGIPNLNLFPIQAIQKLEYQTGVRAFLFGLNSTGGALNIVTQDFYTNRPYSRLRYSEDGYGFLSTDGIFSQNLTRKLNFAAAFQRRTLDGRYPNTNYDAWNVRVKLRFLLSERVNLVLSEAYNQNEIGLNGGVDLSKTSPVNVFDELLATVRNTDSYEKIRRHDLTATLGYRWFGDSSVVSTGTAYYSDNLRQYRDEENRPNPNGIFIQSDHHTTWYGVKLNQDVQKWGNQISLGAEIQRRKVTESPNVGVRDETAASLTGKVELDIPVLKPAVFGRYDRYRGEHLGSYGADVKCDLLPSLSAYGGYSISYRTPTIQELYWEGSGDSSLVVDKEKHKMVEAGILANVTGLLQLRASYFHRRIENAIIADALSTSRVFPTAFVHNVPEETLEGIDGSVALKVWRFSGKGTWTYLTLRRDGIEQQIYPKFFAYGEIAYRQMLFQDHLDLKVGLRGKFFTSNFGEQYNPETMIYVENTTGELNQQGCVDAFLIGKVGTAYIHFILENITAQQYMLTPFYPMPSQKIRFGIEWEFLD